MTDEFEHHEWLKEKPLLDSGRWGYVAPSYSEEINAIHFSIKFAEPGMVCFRTGQTSPELLPHNPWLDIGELYKNRAQERLNKARAIIEEAHDQGRRFAPLQVAEALDFENHQHRAIGQIIKVSKASASQIASSIDLRLTPIPDSLVWAVLPESVRAKCEWIGLSITGEWGMMGHLTIYDNEKLTTAEVASVVHTFRDLSGPELCARILDYMSSQDDSRALKDQVSTIERAWRKEAPDDELTPSTASEIKRGMIYTLQEIRDKLDKDPAIKKEKDLLNFDAVAYRAVESLQRLDQVKDDVVDIARTGRKKSRGRWTTWEKQTGFEGMSRMLWPELFKLFFPDQGRLLPLADLIVRIYTRQLIRSYKNAAVRLDVFAGAQKALWNVDRKLVHRRDQNGQLSLILTSGNASAKLIADMGNAPMIPEYIMRGEGLSKTQTKTGQLLWRWLAKKAHLQRLGGHHDFRRIEIVGGDIALAKELGIARSKTKELRQCIELFTYIRPYTSDTQHVGLITSSLKDSYIDGKKGRHLTRVIIVGEAMLPGFEHRGKKGTHEVYLVPVPTHLPPLFGRHREHGKLLALQSSLWVELRLKASELAQFGGIRLTRRDWAVLAEPVGISPRVLEKTLDAWVEGDVPMLERVGDDRYTLTEHHKEDLGMLMRAGKQSLAGRKGGRKAAQKKKRFTK